MFGKLFKKKRRGTIEPDWERIFQRYPQLKSRLEENPVNLPEIVKTCLEYIQNENSLIDGQHFYIEFDTNSAEIPEKIKKKIKKTL